MVRNTYHSSRLFARFVSEMVYEKLEDLCFEQVKQGAEARLWSGTLFGIRCVAKERFPKLYRHPQLDEILTKDRLRSEARFLHRARAAGNSQKCSRNCSQM